MLSFSKKTEEVNPMPDEKIPESLPEYVAWLKNQSIDPKDYSRFIDRFLDFKARGKGIPLHGKFELTPLCNLDCKMCYVHLNKAQMKSAKLLPVETWKSLADSAIKMGMMKIELTGGECLTYPDFDELYLYLHSFGIEICIFTNGLLLDEKRIEFFKKHPPSHIQVSLYGDSEDTYEAVTGHRQFEKVIGNIKNARDSGLPLIIAVTPNRYMAGKGDDIVRTVLSLGLRIKINFGMLEPRENTDRKGFDHDASLDEYVRMLKLEAESYNLELKQIDEMSLPDLGGNGQLEYGMRCGAGRSGFSIDWQGAMHPCNSLYTISSYPLETGFEAAWKEINDISKTYPRPIECSGCSYRDKCLPCLALHFQGGDAGHANPQICERTRRLVKEGLLKI